MLKSRVDDPVWGAAVLRTIGELAKHVAKPTLDALRRMIVERPNRLLHYQAALSLQNPQAEALLRLVRRMKYPSALTSVSHDGPGQGEIRLSRPQSRVRTQVLPRPHALARDC